MLCMLRASGAAACSIPCPARVSIRLHSSQETTLFYFKGETSEGSSIPNGNPLGVIPLEFAMIRDQGQMDIGCMPGDGYSILVQISPEFWSRTKHHSYLLGVPSKEAQVSLTRACPASRAQGAEAESESPRKPAQPA